MILIASTHISLATESHIHMDMSNFLWGGKSYHVHGRQKTGSTWRIAPTTDLWENIQNACQSTWYTAGVKHMPAPSREMSPAFETLLSQLLCSFLWRRFQYQRLFSLGTHKGKKPGQYTSNG